MEVYVTGKKTTNNVEVLCYKMDSFEIDKKTKIIVNKGYHADIYFDNKRSDAYDAGVYGDTYLKPHRGKKCDIYVFAETDNKIECKYGVGKSGKVLNSYGNYTVSILSDDKGREALIKEFNVETRDIDAMAIRDRINPIIPEAFSKPEVVDATTAKQVLKDTLTTKLATFGLKLEEINIEGINMEA